MCCCPCCYPCCCHHRAVINPSELRVALANHTPFQCQEMNDANELLDTIYECFSQAQVCESGYESE